MREGVGACGGQCKRDKIGDANRGDADKAIQEALDNGLIPLAPFRGVDRGWLMECEFCGHIGDRTTLSGIRQRGHICDPCGRIRTTEGRRLGAEAAAKSMLEAGFDPGESIYPGRITAPWEVICLACTRTTVLSLSSARARRSVGCDKCSDGGGVRPDEPGGLYLVVNPWAGFLKWGIAGDVDNRLVEHRRQRFDHDPHRWDFDTYRDARAVEKAVGAVVRATGATTRITQNLMRYKGYTETASLDEISLPKVRTIIETISDAHRQVGLPD
ncbi:hypothetical protein [Catenulispora rubra]|uniref:hypothetical protein n=1 Tax=Catenulispora rubra TaxID=280293 RepID=UPI0018922CFD|nr:hypothetical protein [Catenulispora rubra]